jgi:hypothetical protein
MMSPADLASAVGRPVRMLGSGFTPDGAPGSNWRGCEYAVGGQSWAFFEVWVDRQDAKSAYATTSKGDASRAANEYRNESGPGFEAYQTAYDTALLKGGTFVEVNLLYPEPPGASATFPVTQVPGLLTRFRNVLVTNVK